MLRQSIHVQRARHVVVVRVCSVLYMWVRCCCEQGREACSALTCRQIVEMKSLMRDVNGVIGDANVLQRQLPIDSH